MLMPKPDHPVTPVQSGKWTPYASAIGALQDEVISLERHRFYMALFEDHSNCGDPNGAASYGDLWGEIPARYGYEAGGQPLTGAIVTSNGRGRYAFGADETAWDAIGGPLSARYAVVYDRTAPGHPLLCCSLLDTTPADVTAPAGMSFRILPNVGGFFNYFILNKPSPVK